MGMGKDSWSMSCGVLIWPRSPHFHRCYCCGSIPYVPCRVGIGRKAMPRNLPSPSRVLGLKRMSCPQECLGIGLVRSQWQLDDCPTSLLCPRLNKNYAPGGWKSGTGLTRLSLDRYLLFSAYSASFMICQTADYRNEVAYRRGFRLS